MISDTEPVSATDAPHVVNAVSTPPTRVKARAKPSRRLPTKRKRGIVDKSKIDDVSSPSVNQDAHDKTSRGPSKCNHGLLNKSTIDVAEDDGAATEGAQADDESEGVTTRQQSKRRRVKSPSPKHSPVGSKSYPPQPSGVNFQSRRASGAKTVPSPSTQGTMAPPPRPHIQPSQSVPTERSPHPLSFSYQPQLVQGPSLSATVLENPRHQWRSVPAGRVLTPHELSMLAIIPFNAPTFRGLQMVNSSMSPMPDDPDRARRARQASFTIPGLNGSFVRELPRYRL